MALEALWIQGSTYPARVDRALIEAILTEGVLNVAAGELRVRQRAAGANMSVEIDPGRVTITGDDQVNQGRYLGRSDAVEGRVIEAAPVSDSRIDLVVARIADASVTGTVNGLLLEVITGTPSASPAVPATPNGAVPLARVAVVAGQVSVTDANITDVRPRAGLADPNLSVATVIAETVLGASAASITFAAIPQTFRHLRLIVTARSDAAASVAELFLRINGNTGANYSAQRLIASGTAVSAAESVGGTSAPVEIIPAANATAGKFGTMDLVLPDYTSTTRHKTGIASGGAVFINAASGLSVRQHLIGWDGIAAIDSLTLLLGSGSFVAGTVATLYGAKGV